MPKEILSSSWPLLRPRDQSIIAAGVALLLTITLAGWLTGGIFRDQANFDRTPAQRVKFIVNINTAPWPEIAQLPGVGETLARRIVESRATDGGFRTASDLRRVHGIGKHTFERIGSCLEPLD